MKKHWKALVAIAAIVIIVAVATLIINLRPADRETQPKLSSDSGLVAGKFGFPVSKINIGEGGTKTAGDGRTPIGYNGTCDSAAQAAANYTPVLRDVNATTWATQKAALNSIAVPGSWVEDATVLGEIVANSKDPLPGAFDGGWVDKTNVKAGGMYRLVSCDANRTAVVQVFLGTLSARETTAPLASFSTATMELTWKDDWKISDALSRIDDVDFLERLEDEGPSGPVPGTPTGKIPVLNDALLDQLFEGKSREGWVEYGNATR